MSKSTENSALAVLTGNKDSLELKKVMYNLATSADTKLSDMINKPFIIKGVIFTTAEVTNRDTGELESKDRVLVIDKDGNAYHSVATGLVNSLHNFVNLFAQEQNGFYIVEQDIPATVVSKDTKNGHTFILKLIEE